MGFNLLAGGKEKSEFMRWGAQCVVPPNLLCDTYLIFLIFHLQTKQKKTVYLKFTKAGSLESGYYSLHL